MRSSRGVRQHQPWMMEAADQVLAGAEVDACLAADGGVYLRQQRCRHLDEIDAAHVDGCEKAGHIADDAAAEGNQDRAAIGASGRQLLCQPLQRCEPLVLLAGGQLQDDWLSGIGAKGAQECLRPQRPDFGRGHDDRRGDLYARRRWRAGAAATRPAGRHRAATL